jgi:hypothetical protein
MRSLRTCDLARSIVWGILPPVEYSSSGSRRFTAYHLDCLRLARQVYPSSLPGPGAVPLGP